MNYQISKEKRIGTDGINQSNYHLFSKHYTFTKLQSSSTTNNKIWLNEVRLALTRKEYVELDDAIRRQVISMRNQMQSFLITNGPLLPIIPRKRPVGIQNNCISDEEQQAAVVWFFGPPAKRARVTPTVTTTDNLQQQT